MRVLAAVALGALALALVSHAHHIQGLPGIARGLVASVVLFAICGEALSNGLLPISWGAFRLLFALPLGAVASGLVLTAFGFAHVPLSVSLWVTLAAGLLASVLVRRRGDALLPVGVRRRELLIWGATLFILVCIALLAAWRTGADTIYGENPDAHQVAGIAVLFQHVPPTGTDNALPIDTVPPAWHFRYSIFYPLAAASNLVHYDPIRVFPAMAALLMVICALGFAALAVRCLGAPAAGAPAVAAAIAASWVLTRLGWHPYWNQLWGLALFPYALLFGWDALAARSARSAILFALMLVALEIAYPLALPYPLVIVAALAIAYRWRPRLPRIARRHAGITTVVVVFVLVPALLGAGAKLAQGLSQVLSPHSSLWGGDVSSLTPVGYFTGTGGGLVPALAVVAVALVGLRALPRRVAVALGIVLAALILLDLRFRLASTGAYMDFKHLSFVGLIVIALAASAGARLVFWGSRRMQVLAVVLAAAWSAAALVLVGREARLSGEQVTPQLFQIRSWAARLPRGASVRVDVPPSGWQLWAVYMVGDHPVDSPAPVLSTTYAHARYGIRADYALELRHDLGTGRREPPLLYAQNPPLFENSVFVLRRVRWPQRGRYAAVRDTSSTELVEP
jgi:hypothetical protein